MTTHQGIGRWTGPAMAAVVILAVALVSVGMGESEPAAAPETAPAPEAKPAEAGQTPKMAFLEINREAGYVDAEGAVCLQEGLLELAVTVTGGKEHEAVFLIKARPQHLHLALLTLGAKPGSPGRWEYKDNRPIPVNPTGDRVAVSILLQRDGKTVEEPIGRFIREIKSKKALSGSEFVFAGSRPYDRNDGTRGYAADESGDVVSMVSFDSELLALPNAASNANEALEYEANPDTVPDVGTKVKLRFRPVVEKKPAKDTEAPKS